MPKAICTAIRQDAECVYPQMPPYDPDKRFIELSQEHIATTQNAVFASVRSCLLDLRMDAQHIGTAEWSPLSDIVKPGNTVVIKPNLVTTTSAPNKQDCTTTHPSVIRPIIDYCWKALKGDGRIIVGDSPGDTADFDLLKKQTGIGELIETLRQRGINVELQDFRATKTVSVQGITVGDQKVVLEAPKSRIINLGMESRFASSRYRKAKLYGGGYDISETTRHHRGARQEYLISETVLHADVVISLPKLKTHRKAGATCCMKNLVGINVDKNYLPHCMLGSVNIGGDEMPMLERKYIPRIRIYNWVREHIIGKQWRRIGMPAVRLLRKLRGQKPDTIPAAEAVAPGGEADLSNWLHEKISGQSVDGGAWPGNHTIADMVLDLNRIFLCCDRKGDIKEKTDRSVFYIIDGVVMGTGNGPLNPEPLQTGIIAAGWNAFRADTSLLTLLNVDIGRIPLYQAARECDWILLQGEGDTLLNGEEISNEKRLPFTVKAPPNWVF